MAQNTGKSTARKIFFGVLLLGFVFGLSGLIGQSVQDRQTVDVQGLFSFQLPAGWTRRSAFNVAEVRGEWTKGNTKLSYIWGQTESGRYSDRKQSWMNDYEETMTRLGGRRADVRTFSSLNGGKQTYYAELNVGNWEKGEVQLFMRIEGADPKTSDLAKEVFKSVTLPLPYPERPTPQ